MRRCVFAALSLVSLSLEAFEGEGLYNQSSLYSCTKSRDLSFSASYLYWAWQQEMLQVGVLVTPTASGADGFFNGKEEVIFQTPGYTSGFQVGLGCNFHGMDDWRLQAEYTWYENSSLLRSVPASNQYLAVSPTLLKKLQGTEIGVLLSGDLTTRAKLNFDEINLALERSYYLGRHLVASFGMGLKTVLIDESGFGDGRDLSFIEQNADAPVSVAGSFQLSETQQSWGVGPALTVKTEWLLGYGLKILGKLSLGALYTRYTALSWSAIGQLSNLESGDLVVNQPHDLNVVNSVAETSLGLGWGSYFCHEKLYVQLSTCYDFNVYWNVGVLGVMFPRTGASGNLLLRGLNVHAGVDF